MRKYLYIYTAYLFILLAIFIASPTPAFASSTDPVFYRITAENTILYQISEDETVTETAICNLPATYFVKPVKTLADGFISVTYLGISGAVKSDSLTPVYSTPTTPFSLQTFALLKTANATVWAEPTTESEYLTSIPYGTTDIVYIGSTTGQKINVSDDGIWYLCKFVESGGGTKIGYVHASLTTALTPFEMNTEVVQLEPTIQTSANILAPELSSTNNLLLILLLTIPAVIILLLIIKPKRNRSTQAKRQIKSLNQISLPDKTDVNDFDF